MRIIFMGTPEFSVGTLEALIEAGNDVRLAGNQPEKPKGRGKGGSYKHHRGHENKAKSGWRLLT